MAKPDFVVTTRGVKGCVVVFHEVWGLVKHTEDVCKRVSKLGFTALAPNLYRDHDDILTPDNIQLAMEGLWELSLEERRDKAKVAEVLAKKKVRKEIEEVAAVLYNQQFRDKALDLAVVAVEDAQSKFAGVASLGFCFGGGLSMKVATRTKHLKSAISFYGMPPPSQDVGRIETPVLAIFARSDELINKSVPEFVGVMLNGGKDLTLKAYPDTVHGFFNDTRESVYNKTAAEDAWEVTRWFLGRTLGRH